MSKIFVDGAEVSKERYDRVQSCIAAISLIFIMKKIDFPDGMAVLLNQAFDSFVIQKTTIEDKKLSDSLDEFEDFISDFIATKRKNLGA